MINIHNDENLSIEKLQLGPYGTNAYVLVCKNTTDSLVIDAPAEADTIMSFLEGTNPRYILLTHDHMDHTGVLTELREALRVPLVVHRADSAKLSPFPEIQVDDNENITLGDLTIKVLHTPGHTPGSICFHTNKHLFSGDTLFPGGPGKTWAPGNFRQIIESIKLKILVLPDDTNIYPGHGEITILKKEREEIGIFDSRPHNPKLCGDVLWLSS